MIRWWVRLWDRRERPTALAIIRILVVVVLLWDLGHAWLLDLVDVLWSPPEVGGLPTKLLQREPVPEVYRWFPPDVTTARGLHAATCAALALFGLGVATRWTGLASLLLYAQVGLVLPLGDRGIDLMMRNVMLILVFSESGRMMSVDAKLRTGSWWGDGGDAPAWPRHLLILQLVVMYFMAGVQKTAVTWTPLGGYHALYIILQDPHIAKYDFAWLESVWPITSLASMTTHLFEWTSPLLLLVYHYRDTRDRPGRLRAFALRWRVHWIWITVGVLLHLGIALTMQLGIFPWAMLSLYPAFFHADEIDAAFRRLTGRSIPAAAPS
ncbi:MAG: HTTM domain-containing protein [Alphaproteobacteria bacterium]|nr:HTTM domain-containing protein [Alphaproteobacteria bacterium]